MKFKLEGKRRLLAAGLFCLVAIGLFIFFQMKSAQKTEKAEPAPAKDPNLYTKSEIDALIKDQISKRDSTDKKSPASLEAKPQDKRKLKTPIAVFVKKSDEARGPVQRDSSKSEGLGIPTGTKIKAHLANTIFSFNVSSPVIAVTDEPFVKDGQILIPQGTEFIGDAAVQKSVDRINVRFSTMVLPGGKEKRIEAMALGLDGSGGIKGKVDKQTDKSLLKAVGETAVAGGAIIFGSHSQALSLGDELRLNAAQNLSEDARQALNQVKIEESITVQAFTPIEILFQERL